MASFSPQDHGFGVVPVSLHGLWPTLDLGELFREHIEPTPAPTECRNCGNPDVSKDVPCRFCQVMTDPKPPRPPEQCPRCGPRGRVQVDVDRDVRAGELWFWVGCHGAKAKAVLTDDELFDVVEICDLRRLLAPRLADAIGRLASCGAETAAVPPHRTGGLADPEGPSLPPYWSRSAQNNDPCSGGM
jgi:hypothetical protein